jgi:hypothetical protein
LQRGTPLDRLESRGTLRIVLKESGLDPKTVTQKQFCVILESVDPRELDSCDVAESHAICVAIVAKIQGEPADRWQS